MWFQGVGHDLVTEEQQQEHSLIPYTKIKWVKDLNIWPDTIKG